MICEVREKLRIRTSHFRYLVLQRGALWSKRDDPTAWCKAYNESLVEDYDSIRPALPHRCEQLLDIGSGLGGLGILLQRHYALGRGGTQVHLLDGAKDPPEVKRHNQPFSDEGSARGFYEFNEGEVTHYIDARGKGRWPDLELSLIVSTKSWCFHYSPDTYLERVLNCCLQDAQLIVDLRRDRPAWREQLERDWHCLGVLASWEKADRTWWKLRA